MPNHDYVFATNLVDKTVPTVDCDYSRERHAHVKAGLR